METSEAAIQAQNGAVEQTEEDGEVQDGISEMLADFVVRRKAMKDQDHYFYLQPISSPTNRRVMVHDREMIMLASYSYLGLIGHPRIDKAAQEAIDEYGTGAGGVRLLTGTMPLHQQLEARIAAFAGRDDSCVYSSGYLTNVAVITGLMGPADLVLMDKLNHASIIDGCFLSGAKWKTYRHNDMVHLEKVLAEARGQYRTVLVISDSVFSMDGDIMDLPSTVELCRRYGARLMVDEAHSIGVLGRTGRGIEEHFRMPGSIDLKMGTISKAIPSVGGYLAADGDVVDYLRHHSRPFIFSAALPPAQAAAAKEAFDVIEDEPERIASVQRNARRLRDGLSRLGYDTMQSATAIVPVRIGEETLALELGRALRERGVFVCPVIHPAVPRGTERLRTTVMATHTDEDIAHALSAFEEAGRELGLIG